MTENWKQITEFPKYKVSNLGNVYSYYAQKILKAHTNGRGYLQLSLYKNKKKYNAVIHRLVLENFIGPPPPEDFRIGRIKECNHIDGNKLNNNIDNLEWITHHENMKHLTRLLGFSKLNNTGKNYE